MEEAISTIIFASETSVIDVPDQEKPKTIKLADFLDEWGDDLKAQVIRNMNPVYSLKTEDDWDRQARNKLKYLIREPFESQTWRGILPVARSFYKEDRKAAFLVGEMGTGKTFMGLAVAHLDPKPDKRIMIQCPGHLVKKWIREAENTIPGCTCFNMNDKSMEQFIAYKCQITKPVGTEIWIIGKERAKLHFQRKRQTITLRGNDCCPECGRPVEYRDNDKAPICEHCGASMWSADRSKVRRYAKAEFIKRFFPKNFFDLLLLDEVHELKGGGTAQGQAMSCLIAKSKKVLALTGTLMGGYSKDLFYLLWRMFPRQMKTAGFEYGRTMGFAERYGVVQRTYDSKDTVVSLNLASIGRKIGRSRIKEAPGISPLLLPDLLLERSAFVRLADIHEALPEYDEIIVPVAMEEEQQKEEYDQLSSSLISATQQALARGDIRLLGKMLQSLLAYPDGCRRQELVTLERDGIEEVVGSAEALDIDLLPKEERLLEILAAEKKQGRKVAVFLEHTGTRDLLPTLEEKLTENGFCPLILRSQAVKPENREQWLKDKVDTGEYDCLICNPNLVKTGLDLLDFPTIVFFQCGYSVFTLRQASRRSWRIGQDLPVRVFFMAYSGTMQEKALSLMAQKMETSLAVEGELSDQGLAALSQSDNSMMYELAKALTGKKSVGNMNDAWSKYKQGELFATIALDDQEVQETITTIIKTTTTMTTATGSASITHKYIVRGKVHVSNDGAVVYVGRNRFDLKAGAVYWAGKKVGWYDRRGCGEINEKPIRIYKPEQSKQFVLAEVRPKAA